MTNYQDTEYSIRKTKKAYYDCLGMIPVKPLEIIHIPNETLPSITYNMQQKIKVVVIDDIPNLCGYKKGEIIECSGYALVPLDKLCTHNGGVYPRVLTNYKWIE